MCNGLIGMPNLTRTRPRYQTHYLHTRSRGGREQRERNTKSGEGRGWYAYPATRQKCGTPVPLYFSSFFSLQIARMHHADPRLPFTREPEFWKWWPPWRRRKAEARGMYCGAICIMLFILRLCPRKYPSFPVFNPSRKTLTSFSPFLFARTAILPLLSSAPSISAIYINRVSPLWPRNTLGGAPEVAWNREVTSEGCLNCSAERHDAPSHKFPARPGKKNEEPRGTSFNAS